MVSYSPPFFLYEQLPESPRSESFAQNLKNNMPAFAVEPIADRQVVINDHPNVEHLAEKVHAVGVDQTLNLPEPCPELLESINDTPSTHHKNNLHHEQIIDSNSDDVNMKHKNLEEPNNVELNVARSKEEEKNTGWF